MRFYLFIATVFITSFGFSQTKGLNLTNALIVGQLDKSEDRFTLEIYLTEMLSSNGINAMPSLNILKEGTSLTTLATDSVKTMLKAKGIDTYVLVSVRGYDRKFKPATKHGDLMTELASGHLFPLYRDEISSITFEFKFFRNGEFAGYDLVKLGGANSRENVMKKFHKKIGKRIYSSWK